MKRRLPTRVSAAVVVLCATLLTGCANWRLPAIDQTGQRIFAPGYTTLDGPGCCCCCCLGGFSRPAFTNPPPVPVCPPGTPINFPSTVPPVAAAPTVVTPQPIQPAPAMPAPPALASGACGALVLSPTQLIAPVGSEVFLRAGLCGGNGHYRTGEKIEWIMTQESVGHLVATGPEEGRTFTQWVTHSEREERRNQNFAVTHTSSRGLLLARGTPDRGDDVEVLAGQAWVSVTSAREGVTHVSAIAPDAGVWDGRRQTATIQWIDAQWTPPPTAIVRAGQPHTLSTVVSRSSDSAPLAGWIVRYELIDGPPAQFVAPDNSATGVAADATTDSNGVASVTIVQTTNQPGTTRVRIRILRPTTPDGLCAPVVVGDAFTSVTWRAPGLAVAINGPAQINGGECATYHIEVTNPGDMPVTNVVVTHVLPPEMPLVSSNPPGQVFGNRVEWRLPDVAPGMVIALDVTCRADGNGDVAHLVTAQSAEGLGSESSTITRIFHNLLGVTTAGPAAVQLGERVVFQASVANLGTGTLTGVVVHADVGHGLLHETGVSRIERPIGDLGPGQHIDFAVEFMTTMPGELCYTLSATANGGHQSATRGCVAVGVPAPPAPPIVPPLTAPVLPPAVGQPLPAQPTPAIPEPQPTPAAPTPAEPQRPELSVRVIGPADAQVGQVVPIQITVLNTGNVGLTNVEIATTGGQELSPVSATQAFFPANGGIKWTIKELPASHQVKIELLARCAKASGNACQAVRVNCDQVAQQDDQWCFPVRTAE
jgi:uncharacterized repeat protein (TIGR01451 family)